MAFTLTTKRNRRKHARYGVGSLHVSLHRMGLLGLFADQVEVRPIDFNATGLAFRHSRVLSPGQPVVMELATEQYQLSRVVGVVRYTTRMKNHFRCGVEFDFSANEHMGSVTVKETLLQIEQTLNAVVILAAE